MAFLTPQQQALQDALNALAASYAAQGGNPSALGAPPPIPAAPPSMPIALTRSPAVAVSSPTLQPNSSMGVIKTAEPIAGSAVLPSTYRPPGSSLPYQYDPNFDPQAWAEALPPPDPFTGKRGMTVQDALANIAPSAPVQKQSGKAPVHVAASPPPGVPVLSPLDAIDRLSPSPPGLPALYGTMPATATAYATEPMPSLPRPRPNVPAPLPMPEQVRMDRVYGPGINAAAAAIANPPPLPRMRPNTVTYAGMTQAPSLFPGLPAGSVANAQDMMGKANWLVGTPLGRLLLGMGFGQGSPAPAAAPRQLPLSGLKAFDGQHFASGVTPGAFFDQSQLWQVPNGPREYSGATNIG